MTRPRRQGRRGFTLVEMTVTIFLMALVGTLLGNAWLAFGRPAIATVARCRVAQEANLAAEALAHDVGLIARPASSEPDTRYQGAQAGSTVLYLAIDDGTGNPRTISYGPDLSDSTKLMRTDLSAPSGPGRVVAGLLAGFDAVHDVLPGAGTGGADVPGVRVDLTFAHRTMDRDPVTRLFRGDYTRRYTLFIPDPQASP
ncbi:MAG TPA: prepilin-type N-terminal cleavage/methylation domain-containing protein [Isosphaeraceae bacterium]|jgi:prepilin-type N-terminal cleavage/methylation domain-containing protein